MQWSIAVDLHLGGQWQSMVLKESNNGCPSVDSYCKSMAEKTRINPSVAGKGRPLSHPSIKTQINPLLSDENEYQCHPVGFVKQITEPHSELLIQWVRGEAWKRAFLTGPRGCYCCWPNFENHCSRMWLVQIRVPSYIPIYRSTIIKYMTL